MTAGSGGGMGAEPGASLSSFSLLGGQQNSCLDQSAGKSTDAGKHAVKPQAGLLPGLPTAIINLPAGLQQGEPATVSWLF